MPDKNYKRGCGKNCLRCWRNKLKHANKVKNKPFQDQDYTITGKYDSLDNCDHDDNIYKKYFNERIVISDKSIYINDIYDDFREWYLLNKFNKTVPNKKTFVCNIKKFLGFYYTHQITSKSCNYIGNIVILVFSYIKLCETII